MRMKALSLGLYILSTAFLLSAAFPEDKGKVPDYHSLLGSDSNQAAQRRRPPMKIPGPKLKNDEMPVNLTVYDTEIKPADEKVKKKVKKDVNLMKDNKNSKDTASLHDDSKHGEKGKKGKGKNKDLVQKDEYSSDSEESQEETNSDTPALKTRTEV